MIYLITGCTHTGKTRLDDSDLDMNALIDENRKNLEHCRIHGCEYFLIDEEYRLPSDL